MKTLRELIEEQEGPVRKYRPGQLKDLPVRRKVQMEGACLTLYRNGCILYERGRFRTAFHVSQGQYFRYLDEEGNVLYGPKDFMDQPWTLFGLLFGEERIETNRKCYDRLNRVISVRPESVEAYESLREDRTAAGSAAEMRRGPEEQLMARELEEELRRYLTPRQMRFFIEAYLLGKTRREIRREWGCSSSVLAQLDLRIREKLEIISREWGK